uniref:HNH endonuclease motif-containing protein n=1 Tax=Salmonella phage PMBT31 TaxID=3153514 RepID=A0AAU8GJY0_9CAUD
MITQELLKELFEYNPDTGDFIRKVSKGRAKAGTIAGSPDKDGYIFIGINRKRYAAHRLAFLYMEGYIPDLVHHLNNIRKDNRWCNLKDATSQENNRNKVAQSNSGYLGG